MSDISHRLAELERIAKANEPNDGYTELYPLAPLEFTKLQHEQGVDGEKLTEIWHGVVDDYEQEHLDELDECLKANTLPPWRRLLHPNGYEQRLAQTLNARALKRYEQYKSEGKI